MEFTGAAFSIAPLISTCTKIVTILRDVGKKFRRAPLMMTSIATECSLIHGALEQLQTFDWTSLAAQGDGRIEQMTRSTETIILGCTLTLSVIEEYASELQEYVEGSKLSPTEQMGIMARVRVLWKEDEMRELLLQLRGYQTGLTNLLRAAHDEDQDDIADVHTTLISLLQRSRASRSRKPLSVRSAMQQSVAYTTLTRSTTTSPTPSNHAFQSTSSGVHRSQSSVSNREFNPGVSAMTADLYDRATSATASRDPVSDRGRRKRPAFLTMRPEDAENHSEAPRYQPQPRGNREHLRRSSPTVGENFTFLEAGDDSTDQSMSDALRRATLQPNGKMSQGVSRPTGKHSPFESNVDDDSEDDGLEEHLDDPPVPPPDDLPAMSKSAADRLSSITEESPQPKKQQSSSSVRSQIIALPETARLRKQASGEHVRQASPGVEIAKQGTKLSTRELLARRRQSDFTHRHQASDPGTLAFRTGNTASNSTQNGRAHPNFPLPLPPSSQHFGVAVSPTGSRPISPESVTTAILSPTSPTEPLEDSWPLTPEMATFSQNGQNHSRSMSEDPSFNALRSLSPDSITPRPSRSGTPLFSNTPYSNTPRRGRSRSNTALQDESSQTHFDDAASIAASSIAPSTMSAQWYRSPRERLGLGGRLRAEVPPWEEGGEGEDHDDDDDDRPYEEELLPQLPPPKQQSQSQHKPRKVQLFGIYPPPAEDTGTAPPMPPRSPLLTDQFLTDVRGLPEDLSPQQQQALHLHHLGNYANHSGTAVHAAAVGLAPLRQGEPPLQHRQAPLPHAVPLAKPPPQQPIPTQPLHQLPTSAIPHRTLSLRSLAPRRSSSRAGANPNSANGKAHKKAASRSIIGEMAKEYKSLAQKWYTGQYDEDDEREVDEQIRRMRERNAAFDDDNFGPVSQLRPATSAGTLSIHDGYYATVDHPAANQFTAASPTNGQFHHMQNDRILRNQPSLGTDSTASSFHTAAPLSSALRGSPHPPGTSGSAKSSSGKSAITKEKEDKKRKKRSSFWAAMRQESKSIGNNWYQEANEVAVEESKKKSIRSGGA